MNLVLIHDSLFFGEGLLPKRFVNVAIACALQSLIARRCPEGSAGGR